MLRDLQFWKNEYFNGTAVVNGMFTVYLINTSKYDEEVARKVGNDLYDASVYAERNDYKSACDKLHTAFERML